MESLTDNLVPISTFVAVTLFLLFVTRTPKYPEGDPHWKKSGAYDDAMGAAFLLNLVFGSCALWVGVQSVWVLISAAAIPRSSHAVFTACTLIVGLNSVVNFLKMAFGSSWLPRLPFSLGRGFFGTILAVWRLFISVLRAALAGVHASLAGVQTYAQRMAMRAFVKASGPGLFALVCYVIALWFCNYKVSIFDEVKTVARSIPFVIKQAVFGWTLDGVPHALFLPAAQITRNDLSTYGWLLVDASRVAALASLLLAGLGAALLAISVAAAVAGWVFDLVAVLSGKLLVKRRKGARFATWWDVFKLRDRRGIAFGHYADRPLKLHTEKHILIMGATRSGKGIALIIPHLLRYPGSAFVLDPKGENARATGRQRSKLNKTVHYLDPFEISGKPPSRFNPLAHFTPENMEAESKALATALVIATERDHWIASAQQLVAAFILYVVTEPTIPTDRKDLNTVRKMLLGDVRDTLDLMKASNAVDGLVSMLARSFIVTPDDERGSIISSAQRETEILDNPSIAACLAASGPGKEVDFAEWHAGTMTVFLCLPAPRFPVFNRWLRLVLTSALDEMTTKLNPPALPVCFMLDELATLGHLPVVENAVGLAAGYGVQMALVFQDVAQMRDLYKGRWASFVGNSGVRALFSLYDYDTAHYWSNFTGTHVVAGRSQSYDRYGMAQNETANETMQPLLSAEQIMQRYSEGRMLILADGARPIETVRVPYFKDEGLAGLWDDPRGPVSPVVPSQGKSAPAPAHPVPDVVS